MFIIGGYIQDWGFDWTKQIELVNADGSVAMAGKSLLGERNRHCPTKVNENTIAVMGGYSTFQPSLRSMEILTRTPGGQWTNPNDFTVVQGSEMLPSEFNETRGDMDFGCNVIEAADGTDMLLATSGRDRMKFQAINTAALVSGTWTEGTVS